MPSSSKTANLGLNKWLGGDKPKKDDFNTDNQKTDEAYQSLNQLIAQASQTLTSHTGNTTSHITAAERTTWNAKDKCVVGTYKGDGTNPRKINLGFAPRFGFFFMIGKPIIQTDFGIFNNDIFGGFFSTSGSAEGVTADSTGFTVVHHSVSRPDGNSLRYNLSTGTYVYIAWA